MPRGDSWSRAIIFVGVDSFRTAVHERDDPSLRGQALAIAGRGRRAEILAVSPVSRALGIEPGAPVDEVQARFPQAHLVAPQPPRYRDANRALTAILRRFAGPERLETLDLGAAYLDVTARTRHGTSAPDEVARRIRFMVQEEIGLTAAAGVATSKFVARIAGTSRGPDALVVVRPGEEIDFLAPLPLRLLGERDEMLLRSLGLRTLGDLAGYDTARLVQRLGTRSALLQRLAQGRDREPVENSRAAKTISAETTFTRLVDRRDELDSALAGLVHRIAGRLDAEAVRARTVYVKLQLADLRAVSRQVSRSNATDDERELLASARVALRKSYVDGTRVKLLGVGLSGLEHPHPEYQLPLFN
ncbi:MAG: DNA polymerase IV [Candidatus Dormibacteraeota bacterium]|nr:DNA polymerase IV [Candidatus Dormibacteraeota bacterium]